MEKTIEGVICMTEEFSVQSEKSLDDDAMIAVDSALAEVFRTRFALKHQKRVRQGESTLS